MDQNNYKEAELIKCCGRYPAAIQQGDRFFHRCSICRIRNEDEATSLQSNISWNVAHTIRQFKKSPMQHDVKKYVLALYMQDGMTMGEIGILFKTNRFRISNVLKDFEVFRERENERNREKTWEDRLAD